MKSTTLLVLSALASVHLVACSDATGSTSGGNPLLDGSTPPVPEQDGGDAGLSAPGCAKDGGTTWTDLYQDCFGPMESNCGGSSCHGAKSSAGGGIWVCGDTKDTCYAGIQTIIEKNTDPTMTTLYSTLRKDPSCGATCMPRGSDFTFAPEDLARIQAWISAGAPNN